jgi:hypothetical protein
MKSKRMVQIAVLGAVLIGAAFWGISFFGHQPAQASTETDNASMDNQTSLIQDPYIIDGLNYLSSQNDLIRLPNGDSLSGTALVQFIIASHIPVVWGSDEICGGGSCSLMYCSAGGGCSYEDGQPGIDPIYLNPSIKSQSVGMTQRLANELAHEAFHRMRYFGSVKISQYEEYWAFYVGSQVVNADWPKFNGIDPKYPQQLASWFTMHAMPGYLSLPPYPGSVAQASPVQASQALPTETTQ